ncbi:MAG: alpha/beta hydrolase, partial [Humidesulfovibrio sp.]|nr:alpha/beta hydrolase [Humidesulfovibrio sp.]
PWRGLVGIGGFLRFCQKPGRDTGTPQTVLDAMLDAMTNAMTNAMPDDISGGLDASPAKVLARFHKRCGHSIAPLPAPGKEGLARLRADLERLRDLDLDVDLYMNLDLPARQAPTLFLHAQDDRIVPPDLPREAQSLLSCSVLTWLPSGGHALPMTRAQDCQRLIQEFLHDLG